MKPTLTIEFKRSNYDYARTREEVTDSLLDYHDRLMAHLEHEINNPVPFASQCGIREHSQAQLTVMVDVNEHEVNECWVFMPDQDIIETVGICKSFNF